MGFIDWLIFACVHAASNLVKPFAHQSLLLVMAVLSVAAYERQPMAARQKMQQCGTAHRRRATTSKFPPILLGSGHGCTELTPVLQFPPSLGSGHGLTEQLPSVGLGAEFAELGSSDEHVDASISPSPGVAEEVAEQRQNERRDSSSEFPTQRQRPSSWWLRLLATLALLAFSLQWLHSQLGQDSQDYFYEIGVFADASVAKGEAVNHRTASTLRVEIFTAL